MEVMVSPNSAIGPVAADQGGHFSSRAVAMSTAQKSTTKSKTTGLFEVEEGAFLNGRVKENKEIKVAQVDSEDGFVS